MSCDVSENSPDQNLKGRQFQFFGLQSENLLLERAFRCEAETTVGFFNIFLLKKGGGAIQRTLSRKGRDVLNPRREVGLRQLYIQGVDGDPVHS